MYFGVNSIRHNIYVAVPKTNPNRDFSKVYKVRWMENVFVDSEGQPSRSFHIFGPSLDFSGFGVVIYTFQEKWRILEFQFGPNIISEDPPFTLPGMLHGWNFIQSTNQWIIQLNIFMACSSWLLADLYVQRAFICYMVHVIYMLSTPSKFTQDTHSVAEFITV